MTVAPRRETLAAAQTEEAGRKLGATLYGDPEIIVDRSGVPLRPAAPEVKPPPEPTFAEVVARYLVEYAKSRLAGSTLDGYQSALKNHLLPKLGIHSFSVAIEVSRSRMLDVELVESGHAVSTRANIQLAFRSVIKFAREVGIQKEVPPVMDLPKRGKKKVPKVPPMADVALLIRTAKHAQHRLLFLLAAHGGLRRGEIRALRCSDGNVPAHVVRELVGHADLSTTQGYAAILSSDQASAVGVLDRALRRTGGAAKDYATRCAGHGTGAAAPGAGPAAGAGTWERVGNGADRGRVSGQVERSGFVVLSLTYR